MTASDRVASLRPVVKVNGSPLSWDLGNHLESLVVDRELNLPGRAVLTFRDPVHEHSDGTVFDVGVQVEIRATAADPTDGRELAIFSGRVSGASVRRVAGDTPLYRVVVDDPSVSLGRVATPRTYVKHTATQVIEEVLTAHGLKGSVASTRRTFDYVLQTVSDQYLVDEMCARSGLVWWYDPVAAKVTAKPYADLGGQGSTKVEVSGSTEIEEYELTVTSLHPATVASRGWDDVSKVSAVGRAASGTPTVQGDFAAKFLDKDNRRSGGSSARAGTTVLRTDTGQHDLETLAAVDLDREVRRAVVAQVTLGVRPAIGPGTVVQIGAPKPLAGRYLVTRVAHEWDVDGFSTRFSTADFGSPLFSGAGTAGSHAFDVPALQTALVTSLADPEKRGRVKVKFPALGDAVDSTWARVAIVGGGKDRGLLWLPELDDEVIVGFEDGDARRAVVLGCLINGRDTFPTDIVPDGRHDIRRMTTKAGNILEFGDGAGKERILLSVPKGKTTVEVSAKGITVDSDSHPLTLKNGAGASIVLDAQGNITIKGKQVTIETDTGPVTVKAKAKLALSGMAAEMVGQTTATVKGSASAELSASGPVTVKGAIVKVN